MLGEREVQNKPRISFNAKGVGSFIPPPCRSAIAARSRQALPLERSRSPAPWLRAPCCWSGVLILFEGDRTRGREAEEEKGAGEQRGRGRGRKTRQKWRGGGGEEEGREER